MWCHLNCRRSLQDEEEEEGKKAVNKKERLEEEDNYDEEDNLTSQIKEQSNFESVLENERSRLFRVSKTYLNVPTTMAFNSSINNNNYTGGNI